MSLGTSIFLSVIFVGFTLLIIKTKDTWNWKKIFIKSILSFVSLCIFIGLSVWGYVEYKKRPVVQSSFWGIELGTTQKDILFKKGKPTRELLSKRIWVYEIKENYSHKFKKYYLVFDKDRRMVSISFDGSDFYDNVQGIYIGSYLNKVLTKFGKPSNITSSKDGLLRTYSFEKYNVSFNVKKEKVIGISVESVPVSSALLRYKK